jgi:hypothetical protein
MHLPHRLARLSSRVALSTNIFLPPSRAARLVRVRVLHGYAARPRFVLCAAYVTGFGGVRGLLSSRVCGRPGGGAGRGKVLETCAGVMCAFGAARA